MLSALTASLTLLAASQQTQASLAPSRYPGFAPGAVAVVTTDGFFLPDKASSTPRVHLPPASFGGVASLAHPAIEWQRGSAYFVIASGDRLWRVGVYACGGLCTQVVEITPQSAVPADFFDVDIHPGSGELFVLDQTTDQVLRFEPPFALGMTPDLAIPIGGTSRSLAIDSRANPSNVVVGENSGVLRFFFDGSSELISLLQFPNGVDQDPQVDLSPGCFVTGDDDIIGRATNNPNLLISLNYGPGCVPLALDTKDVEWDPVVQRAFVLAEDGVNSQCALGAVGPNHVVKFPLAQISGVVEPKLVTFAGGSGITGVGGDVAVVRDDFAFVSPFGTACDLGAPGTARLDLYGIPEVSTVNWSLQLEGAPADSAVTLVLGTALDPLDLPSGCELAVRTDVLLAAGSTDGQGELTYVLTLPGSLLVGSEVFVQAAIESGPGWAVSNGLRVHVGL